MPIIFAQALMFIPMFFTRFEATRRIRGRFRGLHRVLV